MNSQQINKQKGFTIIEVVLVLAIAGLIFLMVFIALPALQRSQRDTQRKNDLSRLNTAISSYQSNNRGSIPSGDGAATNNWGGFVTRYVRTNGDTFTDPSGTDYIVAQSQPLPATFDGSNPVIKVTPGAICNGEAIQTGQPPHKVAIQMKLEGSGTACQSN